MTKYDNAMERFRMSRLDIDAIEHTTFEPIRCNGRQLIDEAYKEFEDASIKLHSTWNTEA